MTSWTFEWQRDVNDWVQYEPKVNDILSDALSREQTTVEFSGSNGIVYVINFNQKTQTQKNNSRRYRHIRYFSGPSSNLSSLGSLPSVKQPKPVIGHAPDFKTASTFADSCSSPCQTKKNEKDEEERKRGDKFKGNFLF